MRLYKSKLFFKPGMKKNKEFLLLGILMMLMNSAVGQNQLINPGFEMMGIGWNFWGGVQQNKKIKSGDLALKVSLDKPKWSGVDQVIPLSDGIKKITVSGWMKTENVVQGSLTYEKARIAVEFHDNKGIRVGGYPPVTCEGTGTSDWTYCANTYEVPKGTRQVKIQLVLGNCMGTVYFDDLELLLFDENGMNKSSESKSGPMDEGQWYVIERDSKNTGGHYVDWSSLLDAPAGKHGFAKAVNGHIQFEDGVPVRFWGTNLVAGATFPSKEQADSLAKRLSRMGCNLVRFHHMDAPWSKPNIFGDDHSAQFLSPESLDKMDYLISVLKKKGIYIYMDLLVHRDFGLSPEIENKPSELGGKQVAYFDKKIIGLQKDYIRQLLIHKNPYTGNTYINEPAIVGSEFINESSVFLHFSGDVLTEPYRKELQLQFEAAGNKGKKLSVFELDYSAGSSPLLKSSSTLEGINKTSLLFLSKVEQEYYSEMKNYMRSLGVKYLLSGSNFPCPILAYQFDNYKVTDLILTNDYWDHPQLWKVNNDWNKILSAPLNNTSMIKNPALSVINNISKYKWYTKPLLITEYNACYPNEYILEAVPFVAAYSSLQDIDGILQFDFNQNTITGEDRISSFNLSNMYNHLAQWVIGAPVFLREDVAPAKGIVLDTIKEQQLYSLPNYSDFLDKRIQLPFITKVAKVYGETNGIKINNTDPLYDDKNNRIKSETGQLALDLNKSIMSINSPNIQGAVGALKDSSMDLPFISFKVKNSWASLFIISIENKPLVETKRFYLVAVTPVKMSGQQYNPGRNALVNPGKPPYLAQTMVGEFVLKTKASKMKITGLRPDGTKEKNTIFVDNQNGIKFDLDKGKTFVYEIEIE
jgi:hypothetical protein